MASGPIRGFIHKGGKIIPLHSAGKVGRAAYGASRIGVIGGSGYHLHRTSKEKKGIFDFLKPKIKVNHTLDALGLGTAVASGALGALTFTGGLKTFAGGFIGGHALDAAGIALNAASVAGRGRGRERFKQGAKQEARNLVIGNAVYVAGLVGMPRNRQALVSGAKTVGSFVARKGIAPLVAFARRRFAT